LGERLREMADEFGRETPVPFRPGRWGRIELTVTWPPTMLSPWSGLSR
jgi:hypothetical protein